MELKFWQNQCRFLHPPFKPVPLPKFYFSGNSTRCSKEIPRASRQRFSSSLLLTTQSVGKPCGSHLQSTSLTHSIEISRVPTPSPLTWMSTASWVLTSPPPTRDSLKSICHTAAKLWCLHIFIVKYNTYAEKYKKQKCITLWFMTTWTYMLYHPQGQEVNHLQDQEVKTFPVPPPKASLLLSPCHYPTCPAKYNPPPSFKVITSSTFLIVYHLTLNL